MTGTKKRRRTERGLSLLLLCCTLRAGYHQYLNIRLLDAIRANKGAEVVSALRHGAGPNAGRFLASLIQWRHDRDGAYLRAANQERRPLVLTIDYRSRMTTGHLRVLGYCNADPAPENLAIVGALLQAGADVTVRNEVNCTPLMLAAWQGKRATVSLLLDYDTDINAQDKTGHTALMLAIAHGDLPTIKVLLAHGADVDTIRSKNGYTALSLAQGRGDWDIYRVLTQPLDASSSPR